MAEKRPLVFNVQKFSVHDGPGIRTTIFFKGCPLACPHGAIIRRVSASRLREWSVAMGDRMRSGPIIP